MNILHQAARRLERLEALDKVAKPRAGAVGRAVRPRVVRNLLVAGRGLAGCCVLGNEFEDAQVAASVWFWWSQAEYGTPRPACPLWRPASCRVRSAVTDGRLDARACEGK